MVSKEMVVDEETIIEEIQLVDKVVQVYDKKTNQLTKIVDVATQTDDLVDNQLVTINIQILEIDTTHEGQVVPQLEEQHE